MEKHECYQIIVDLYVHHLQLDDGVNQFGDMILGFLILVYLI